MYINVPPTWLGHPINVKCKKCASLLIKDNTGTRWCSNPDCQPPPEYNGEPLWDDEFHELCELRLRQSSDELDYNNADIP